MNTNKKQFFKYLKDNGFVKHCIESFQEGEKYASLYMVTHPQKVANTIFMTYEEGESFNVFFLNPLNSHIEAENIIRMNLGMTCKKTF